MRRREFIAGMATITAANSRCPPLIAQDSSRTYRVGFMIPAARESPAVNGFFDELRLNGFIEGQNLAVVFSGFNVSNEQIAESVGALIRAKPDVVVAGPELYVRALRAATKTIPLVSMSEDLVGTGLAASLARPGGNVTGISLLSPELDGKRQGLLIEAVPQTRAIAALVDSSITPQHHLETLRDAAQSRGVTLSFFMAAKPNEIAPALDGAKAKGADAINILATSLFFVNRKQIIDQTAKLRLPAIYQWPEMAEEGGLLAYGSRFTQVYRQRARQIVKILGGAKAAEVPIEQPTNFVLVINLKTAKSIGHEIPAGLVLRADEVIE
jgi:putative tryptophan/tyrosine transport system substrate-binding protein